MPIRHIKKSHRSVTGHFMSRKNKRHIGFESTLEHDFYLTLEFDPSVVTYEEQPFKIQYECDGSNRFYTPDCLVQDKHSTIVYEVKYQNELDQDSELRKKYECVKRYFQKNGQIFHFFTDQSVSQIYLQNLKFLYKFAFLKKTEQAYNDISHAYGNLVISTSIQEFLASIAPTVADQQTTLPYLWNFLSINPHLIDLKQKLSMHTHLIGGQQCLS